MFGEYTKYITIFLLCSLLAFAIYPLYAIFKINTQVNNFLGKYTQEIKRHLPNNAPKNRKLVRTHENQKQWKKMTRSRLAQHAIKNMQAIWALEENQVEVVPLHEQTISEEIHTDVAEHLKKLAKNSYLSASDFGYLGLFVPGELYDVLKVPAEINQCS